MEELEFCKYLPLVKEAFKIFPAPRPRDSNESEVYFRSAKFMYLEHNGTHVKIQDHESEKCYNVPLALVEFVNQA
jgi:hypothetical protein